MQEDVITSGPRDETGERRSLYQWPGPLIQASNQIGHAHNDKNSSGGENVYVVFPTGLLLKWEYWHNVSLEFNIVKISDVNLNMRIEYK